jgi:ribosome-associated protein
MARTRTRTSATSPQPAKGRLGGGPTPDRFAETRSGVLAAIGACEAKKAGDIALLALDENSGAFTDFFVICSGSNPRQIQAISDEVEQQLSRAGLRPTNVEGYQQAEWVLLDYVDFVIHVFSEAARKYYDLERLWKSARRIEPSELRSARKKPAQPASRARSTARSSPKRSPATARTRKGSSRTPKPPNHK